MRPYIPGYFGGIMGRETCTVMIGGEAGQGLVTIGDILTRILVRSGHYVVVTQDYQSRIRGGHNTFVIRAATREIEAPGEAIDVLVALDEETVRLHRGELSADGLMIVDAGLGISADGALGVPFGELAEGRFINMAALGIAATALGLDLEVVAASLEKAFGKKHPETLEKNLEAVEKARTWYKGNGPGRDLLAKAAPGPAGRLIMNGNEAVALGAMAAGARFCSFYPMTPSTSVALNLVSRAERMGLVVEQAEDEIAAVNMALGASYAGAPSMVTTSGGGFALMAEGVSLAAMIETPIVVVVVQRPGPATGLPTRTEQADLEFVLYAGHGEFPRAVLTPGSVEECFELTRRAFDLAERFQGPVFVLSDQFLADSLRAVRPFDLSSGPVVNPARAHGEDVAGPYRRYEPTETGVSPRLLPGLSEHLVVVDSDEHTEDGHLTEDLSVRVRMNDKRLRKLNGLKDEVIPPAFSGDASPDLLLVCWGSARGAVLEAAAGLRAEGRRVGALYFSQVWPMVPDTFLHHLEEAGRVVGVEGNATGQLARLIRGETGYPLHDLVLRYDGLPITPEFIRRAIEA